MPTCLRLRSGWFGSTDVVEPGFTIGYCPTFASGAVFIAIGLFRSDSRQSIGLGMVKLRA